MRNLFFTILIVLPIVSLSQVITTPPASSNLRAMAEWEEVQALTIAWTDYPAILKQIVAAGRLETEVIILSDDPASTEDYLLSTNTGGDAFADLNNVTILEADYNSIWMRDYAANPVYVNEVDSLFLVDWMYNRPRPADDASPEVIADYLGLSLYATTEDPYDLRYTGGNYMSDGFGTAFASELILNENDGTGDYNIVYPVHTESEINDIMNQFMGIETYIKMPALPYDGINHIDMHMKLIDEETLLVGEYPEDIADGPQINANIEYVLSNYESVFGTPYNVVRIPMPDSQSGLYPDNGGSYRTYTNAVFVNNTIIFPTYREEYDTTAFRIWGEVCPGYNLVGIDCDNQGNNIISLSGAIHCITHTVGVADPLLISHNPLDDTYETVNPYAVTAHINHRSGIENGKIFWRYSGATDFNEIAMTELGENNWTGSIPAQPAGSVIEYYISGESISGKVQQRPMPAPEGFWTFHILGEVSSIEENNVVSFGKIFPNPASSITCLEINNSIGNFSSIYLTDMAGRKVMDIYNGQLKSGLSKFFIDASTLSAGVYQLVANNGHSVDVRNFMVK